jgi:hypothetical protein
MFIIRLVLEICIIAISIHQVNSYKLKYLDTVSGFKILRINRITGRHAFFDKDHSTLRSTLPNDASDLDLPEFIQSSNKLTVEFVKGILSIIYANRSYAR